MTQRAKGFCFEINVSNEIKLKLMHRNDAREMFLVTKRNKDFLKQWLKWASNVKSERDSLQKILSDQKGFSENNSLELGIFKSGKFIGRIGFRSITGIQAEIGYWLDHSENGQGIITKSCKALIRHTFRETNIHRIIIKMDTENVPSRKIPERLGFTCEGVERASVLLRGEYRNSYVYSLLKTDPIIF